MTSSSSPRPGLAPGVAMESADMARVLKRLAHEIVERNRGTADLVLAGIRSRGMPLAERMAALLEEIEGQPVPHGALDISLYRDDYGRRPITPSPTTLNFNINDRIVVLVDDVLFTGRTVRSALNALGDLGRPAAVQLAVLIDRGHRELPIRPDFVGKNLPTARGDRVVVQLRETDAVDEVRVEKP